MQLSSIFTSNQISQVALSRQPQQESVPQVKFSGDTVSISAEALAALGDKMIMTNDILEKPASYLQPAKQQETSLKSSRFNILGMLLESLFLAELEKGKAPTSDTNGDPATKQKMQEKPNNLLNDGGKVAEIKSVIEDFSTGKVSLSELPKAMSSGKSETHDAALKNTNVSGKDDIKKY